MIRLEVCLLVGHLMSSVGKCTALMVSFILKQNPQRDLLPGCSRSPPPALRHEKCSVPNDWSRRDLVFVAASPLQDTVQ